MLTRLREGTPDATGDGRSDPAELERVPGAPVRVSGLAHSFGDLAAIETIDLEASPARCSASSGPPAAGRPRSSSWSPASARWTADRSPSAGEPDPRSASSAAPTCRNATSCSWLSAIDNAALALRIAGASGRTPEHARRPLRAPRARRIRAIETRRAPEDAPASRLPADADGGPPGAPPRRAVRLARCDHPCRDAVLARRGAGPGSPHRPPGHARRRGGLYLSDRVLVLGPRPARVVDRIEIDGPRAPDRAAAVTSPEFAELKERALRSLSGRDGERLAAAARPSRRDRDPARRVGARRPLGLDLGRAQHRGLPRPRAERHRRVALARPLPARRRRLGDRTRGRARLPDRPGSGPCLRDRAPPFGDPAPGVLPAAGRLADDPRWRSLRSWSSGSASASGRSSSWSR